MAPDPQRVKPSLLGSIITGVRPLGLSLRKASLLASSTSTFSYGMRSSSSVIRTLKGFGPSPTTHQFDIFLRV